MPSERIQKRVDALLNEADTALTRNDWQVAIERARAALALDRENADAKQYLEAAEYGLGAHGAARPQEAATPPQSAPSVAPQVSQQVHPTSFASGRYAVKKFLGEGGKKKVYLAHDTTLDRDVAFALIKSEGLDDSSRQRITREAQAMGRLGDHPNIVPIFDLGQERDPATGIQQPFMVLPLMTGGDVEGEIEKAPDHRMPLERVLQIAKDTCEGLVFAHSKGIVHRDLKPGNVWLTERGVARIGDFGLAVATDRSRLTREGMMVGTVAYMPPEQAMGGEITPRADLYSLGAMLYEMVTGRPPFLGDDDIGIIGQHINTPPVAPSWHNPQCPRPLEALITRLLAKDPAQRPGSAQDVLSALAVIDLSTIPSPKERGVGQPPGEGDPEGKGEKSRSLDSMSSGVFVGRHKEMDQLRAALEETLSGHGRMVTLVGEPGIGKTRTAQELATYAGLRRCQVLWGRCYEGGGAPPYWPWVQVIRSYVRGKDAEDLRREMGSTASVLAEIVADLKDRMPWLKLPPELESPESARFRLFDSVAAFLGSASQSQPLVIVLDDLHWSDKPSLLLTEFIARELSNSRVLLVGTYRDVEVNRRHPLSQTLGELAKERLFERVLLRGIQREDVAKFIEIAAGIKPPVGLVDAVHTQTEGNPLFATEVVRWLVQEGTLTREKVQDKKSWSMPIPEGLRDVIGKRLDRLSARCNDVLITAAIVGRRFALPALVKLYSDPSLEPEERLSEDRLLEAVEEALAARIVEELPSGPGRYQFTHALIQETLEQELSTTRRVRLHARIALALEALYGDRSHERAAELAAHFAEAESLLGAEKLVKYCLLAGQQALAAFGYEEALRHFQCGLVAMRGRPMEENQARLYWGLGQAQAGTLASLSQQTTVDTLRRALDYYLGTGDIESAVGVCESLPIPISGGTTGGTNTASPIEATLRRVVPGSIHELRLLARFIESAGVERGDLPAARDAYDKSISLLQRYPDAKLELRVMSAMLTANGHNTQLGYQVEDATNVIEHARRIGDLTAEARGLFHLANAHRRLGHLTEAEHTAQSMLSVAEKLKFLHHLENAMIWVSITAGLKGDWESAKKAVDRGLSASPDLVTLLAVRFNIELLQGDFAAARVSLEAVLREMGSTAPGPNHPHAAAAALIPYAAYVRGLPDRLDVAERSAMAIIGSPSSSRARVRDAHIDLAMLAVVRGDRAAAEVEYAGGKADLLETFHYHFWVDHRRLLGLLAQTIGDYERAEQHLDDAQSFLRKAGYRVELGWVLHELAVVKEARGAVETQAIASLHEEALQIARGLGMKPLIERIIARKKILKA